MKKLLALISAAALTSVATADVTIDLAGIYSMNGAGDAENTVLSFDVGAGMNVIGISYSDVSGMGIDADGADGGPSWGNEMRTLVSNSASEGVNWGYFPAEGSGSAGGPWSADDASYDLVALELDFVTGDDGLVFVEFYEGYNDHAGADAMYTSGSLTIHTAAIPAPGAIALLGVAGLATRRRRK